MINSVTLVGSVEKSETMRFTPSGQPVLNFSLETIESWMGKDGTAQQRSEWHRVVAFGKVAEQADAAIQSGAALLYIQGKLQTRQWKDKSGETRYTTEVSTISIKPLVAPQQATASSSASDEITA